MVHGVAKARCQLAPKNSQTTRHCSAQILCVHHHLNGQYVNLERATRSFSLPSLSSQPQASVPLGDGFQQSVLQDVNLEEATPLFSPVSSPSTPSRTYNRDEISLTQLLSNVSGCSHMQPTNPTLSTSPRLHLDVTLSQKLKTPTKERQHTICSLSLPSSPSTH